MKKTNFLLLCLAAVLCISCQGNLGERSNRLFFRVSMTRGAAITTDSLNKANQFFIVNAYLEAAGRGEGTGATADKTKARYIDSVKFTHDGSKWSATGCTWRNQVATNFWCYKPAQMTYGTRTITHCDASSQLPDDDAQKTMLFTYEMPSDQGDGTGAEKLEDMIFAYARKTYTSGGNNTVNIEFRHALSAIRFKAGNIDSGYDIESITIKGFKTSGSCVMTGVPSAEENVNDTVAFVWTPTGDATTDGYKQNITKAQLTAGDMVDGDKMFIVIPQSIDENATVTVVFTNGGTKTSKTAPLCNGSLEWKAGKYYAYKLNYSGSLGLTATLEDFNGTDWTTHDTGSYAPGTFTGDNW